MTKTEPRIGSLCSGYGGLDLGLISALGGSVIWHAEVDENPAAVLAARWPSVPNLGDITSIDWLTTEPADWLTAGYPCQPFSPAGKRLGANDERHLWPAVRDAIGVLRPRNVLLENVAGHVSLGLDAVLADLAALGYDTRWGVVRASDAGAPHGRARLFIVAADAVECGRGAEGQQRGLGPAERLAAAASDPGGEAVGLGAGLRESGAGGVGRGRPDDDAAPSVSDAEGDGRDEGWTEPAGLVGRPDAAQRGHGALADTERGRCAGRPPEPQRGPLGRIAPAGRGEVADPAADSDRDGCGGVAGLPAERRAVHGDGGGDADGRGTVVEWGAYGPAIARWEAITGRTAPRPTERGNRGGERLSPRFVEWMQGLPDGWVTDVLARSPALKALGNGVVPQQAALAVSVLLHNAAVAA